MLETCRRCCHRRRRESRNVRPEARASRRQLVVQRSDIGTLVADRNDDRQLRRHQTARRRRANPAILMVSGVSGQSVRRRRQTSQAAVPARMSPTATSPTVRWCSWMKSMACSPYSRRAHRRAGIADAAADQSAMTNRQIGIPATPASRMKTLNGAGGGSNETGPGSPGRRAAARRPWTAPSGRCQTSTGRALPRRGVRRSRATDSRQRIPPSP